MPEQLLHGFQDLVNLLSELITQLQIVSNLLIALIPVGIIGLWRWGVWLVRKLVGLRYQPIIPSGYTTSTSIVTPVYNEDPEIFRQALDSWVANRPNEIIAVIDYTDETNIANFRKFEEECATTGVVTTRLIITKTPGKRAALVDGVRVANGEIVFLVDSDTLWEKDVLVKAIAPFEDPEVGGVTTRQNVLSPHGTAQRLFDVYLDVRYLEEMRFLAATGDMVTCISGRTGVYRRSAILPLMDQLLNETFWGQKVIAGDDKRLTHLLQEKGWKVRYQEQARVYTPGFSELGRFIRQRVRWARNSWRADLRALFSGWVWRRPIFAFHLIDRIFQPLTTLVSPTYMVLSIYHQDWFTALVILVWWIVSRTVKIWMHLRRRRSSIVILPAYIFFAYFFALVRIYAFFTMNHQSWVTRWDRSRMRSLSAIRSVLSYAATGIMVAFVVLGINLLYNQRFVIANISDPNLANSEMDLPAYNAQAAQQQITNMEPPAQGIGATDVGQGVTFYEIGAGDTLPLLAQKYGLAESAITLEKGSWRIGERIKIQLPFKNYTDYRNALPPIASLESGAKIEYKPEIKAITVAGNLAVVDIPTLYRLVNNPDAILRESEGVYILKANLELKRHTVLLIEAPQVTWLKLKSDETGSVRIFGDSANIGINGVKISSWDIGKNDFDKNSNDGRAHIRVNNGRMDLVNTEIMYIGQPKLRGSGGGVYGLSWRVENSSRFQKEMTTGSFENNSIHDNYIGFYSFGATAMTIRNNEVFNNEQYGLDPHDDSNNFIVEDNYIHNNGNHGIIFSRRCLNNIVRRNRSINNRLHGIMLDRESNNNSIYDNETSGNVDGIALWRSDLNLIYNNKVLENKRGFRLNRRSADNVIRDNSILNSTQYGMYLYEEARANWIVNNQVNNSKSAGVYVRALDNYIFNNQIAENKKGIYLNEDAIGNQISMNQLTSNESAFYLKTAPDDFLVNNIFQSNSENIRFTEVWYTVKLGAEQPTSSFFDRFKSYLSNNTVWNQVQAQSGTLSTK